MELRPYLRQAQYYETDQMGVIHHANYIHWMEEARVDYLDQSGFGYRSMEALGISSPVLRLACEYRRSVAFGETVEIRGGSLYIDGTETPLPGDGRLMAAGLAEAGVTLGEGEYFVLGDDPETSEDSRFANVGSVERNQILGKVWFRISPLSRLGFVN